MRSNNTNIHQPSNKSTLLLSKVRKNFYVSCCTSALCVYLRLMDALKKFLVSIKSTPRSDESVFRNNWKISSGFVGWCSTLEFQEGKLPQQQKHNLIAIFHADPRTQREKLTILWKLKLKRMAAAPLSHFKSSAPKHSISGERYFHLSTDVMMSFECHYPSTMFHGINTISWAISS